MQPSIWGPYLWRAIHYIALGYPDKPDPHVKHEYRDFFLNLWKFIPCIKCSLNYKRHLHEIPNIEQYLSSPKDLFQWTWLMHNIVNKELGKQQIEFDFAYNMYTNPEFLHVKLDGTNDKIEKEINNALNQQYLNNLIHINTSSNNGSISNKNNAIKNHKLQYIIITISVIIIIMILLLFFFGNNIKEAWKK